MIADSAAPQHSQDWQKQLSNCFRSLESFLRYCQLPVTDYTDDDYGFSFKVTPHFASLIEKGNPNDPLLLQVVPQAAESLKTPGYVKDAVGDLPAMIKPGLIHKYNSRVLLTITGACPIHCRYCFRRHYDYRKNSLSTPESELKSYLQQHPEINEVILSGGDPLILSDKLIHSFVKTLNELPQIRVIRIHSRLASTLPQRFTDELIEVLQSAVAKIILVTHINHPQEINELNQSAFELLAASGIRLLNQSVLLKKINDDAAILESLSWKLFDFGILPYYLHQLDPVQGVNHFELDQSEVCLIYTKLQSSLPGYLLPKLVLDKPGHTSKTLLNCV